MDRSRFVGLAVVAFGLVLAGFLVRGTARLVVPLETAAVISAPFLTAAFLLVCVLVVTGALDLLGIHTLE